MIRECWERSGCAHETAFFPPRTTRFFFRSLRNFRCLATLHTKSPFDYVHVANLNRAWTLQARRVSQVVTLCNMKFLLARKPPPLWRDRRNPPSSNAKKTKRDEETEKREGRKKQRHIPRVLVQILVVVGLKMEYISFSLFRRLVAVYFFLPSIRRVPCADQWASETRKRVFF